MRALVAFEASGKIRRALQRRGWDVYSCDLRPAEDGETERHWICDAVEAAYERGLWDLLIAHPVCTYLTNAAAWCMYHPDDKALPVELRRPHPKFPDRKRQQDAAAEMFMAMVNAPAGMIAVENPVGVMGTRYRPPDQILQPYEFGHDASKKTAIWGVNFPKIPRDPAKRFPGRWVIGPNGRPLERWANQTDSGQNRLSPGGDRWRKRSLTYDGIAEALAEAATRQFLRGRVFAGWLDAARYGLTQRELFELID